MAVAELAMRIILTRSLNRCILELPFLTIEDLEIWLVAVRGFLGLKGDKRILTEPKFQLLLGTDPFFLATSLRILERAFEIFRY